VECTICIAYVSCGVLFVFSCVVSGSFIRDVKLADKTGTRSSNSSCSRSDLSESGTEKGLKISKSIGRVWAVGDGMADDPGQ
jgi:hypothetical protein